MTNEERREYAREYSKKYRAEHLEEARAYGREYAKRWREQWRAANPGAVWKNLYYIKKGRSAGADHHMWKGDDASYYAIHIWVTGNKGRPSLCERCGTTTAKRFEWANVDHKYRRELGDYFRACTSCHRRYDYEHGLSEKGHRWKNRPPSE